MSTSTLTLVNNMVASLEESVRNAKLLVVGAGGIGCEILKNLVLSGFKDIVIIDLDTIDLSNLNRQFLFQRHHIGKPKAVVARESVLQFTPNVKIEALHDSIMATMYGVTFFKQFNVVLNALDNRQARNHVNRMCLNAEVPLIESGTAGYNGQVELIQKRYTQCYECTPKATPKTYPGCTIRNTPSAPIHCIVWAKHLFNQLFGETVDDEDISPDIADPQAKSAADENGDAGVNTDDKGNILRISTRHWAKSVNYDPETLFNKLFHDDVRYLLSMENLWKTRKAPTPIKWDSVVVARGVTDYTDTDDLHNYYKVWKLNQCAAIFAESVREIAATLKEIGENESLMFDKDDAAAMNFVTACSGIRSYVFDIKRMSRFEVQSMAGNIIPAIATTNAITAGVVVLKTFKALQQQYDKCKTVYIRARPNVSKQLLVTERMIFPPLPTCYVCSADPAIHLKVDTNHMTIKDFRSEVLIKTLNMVNPDVIIHTKGVVVISSEEGETECNDDKLLREMDVVDGVFLKCDDFFQNYELSIIIIHIDAENDEPTFEVIADKHALKPKKDGAKGKKRSASDADDGPSTSKKPKLPDVIEADDISEDHDDDDNDGETDDDDDDDVCVVVENDNADDKNIAITTTATTTTAAAAVVTTTTTTSTSTSTTNSTRVDRRVTATIENDLKSGGNVKSSIGDGAVLPTEKRQKANSNLKHKLAREAPLVTEILDSGDEDLPTKTKRLCTTETTTNTMC